MRPCVKVFTPHGLVLHWTLIRGRWYQHRATHTSARAFVYLTGFVAALALALAGCSAPSYQIPEAFCEQSVPGQCGLAEVDNSWPLTPPAGQCWRVYVASGTALLARPGTDACDAADYGTTCVMTFPGDPEPAIFDVACADPDLMVDQRTLAHDGTCPVTCEDPI